MTSPSNHIKDRFDRIAEQYKDSVSEAVRGWSAALERLSAAADTAPPASTVVDTLFDLAELQLRRDRDFTKGVLELLDRSDSTPAAPANVTSPTKSAPPTAASTPVTEAADSPKKASTPIKTNGTAK